MAMGFLRWLSDRLPNSPLHHVSSVAVDERGMLCVHVNGDSEAVRWDQIDRVSIRTTDKGPFDDDVFFVLATAVGTLVIPQPARGSGELLRSLQQLPDFDNEAVIEAMACTDNREFLCWPREGSDGPGRIT